MPGHTTSWLAAYPQLGSASGPYHIEPPLARVRSSRWTPRASPLTSFWTRSSAKWRGSFPDRYFHIGGDEVNGQAVESQPAHSRLHAPAPSRRRSCDFRPISTSASKQSSRNTESAWKGWDEILDPDLPKDIVIQSWRGQKSLAQAAQHGFSSHPVFRLLSGPHGASLNALCRGSSGSRLRRANRGRKVPHSGRRSSDVGRIRRARKMSTREFGRAPPP